MDGRGGTELHVQAQVVHPRLAEVAHSRIVGFNQIFVQHTIKRRIK